ncbi:MAG TPA: DHA2 family efflux MFS transporter permease subunit [Opitutales bacterium]|jgi:DHA2 family multidrug resistance protein|nr:DHA2 family efflux MFS transporter permease subunit [Opitutales bacterium]
MSASIENRVINPWWIALAVMLATFMEVLDTAIANVALPHIAGSLSAGLDEATWVVTSYLVSNAIVLPASAWFSRYFGRKKFLITCIGIFTISSFLCGIAPTLGLLIGARILQGAGGGALQPLAQAIMLESFPPAKRGMAMAVYAMGVIVAPIFGPIVGGWITDNYSWGWIFYINIPIGLLAIFLINRYVFDPEHITHSKPGRIDAIGFGLMAVGLAALQIILDKGQEDDWFAANWICVTSLICAVTLTTFVFWELKQAHPIVDLRIFRNRNFTVGTILIVVVGVVVYVPTTLLPQYLQGLMGYTAQQSGAAQCSRGLGVLLLTFVAGYLTGKIDSRKLIFTGFMICGVAVFWVSKLNLDISMASIIWPNFMLGLGMALVFVPLTTTTMGMLRNSQMGNATGLYSLMRNLGASVGISLMTTLVARHAQVHQVALVAHATPYDAAYQARVHALNAAMVPAGVAPGTSPAVGMIYQTIIHQATAMAFVDAFRWLALLCLISVPIIFFFKKVQSRGGPVAAH